MYTFFTLVFGRYQRVAHVFGPYISPLIFFTDSSSLASQKNWDWSYLSPVVSNVGFRILWLSDLGPNAGLTVILSKRRSTSDQSEFGLVAVSCREKLRVKFLFAVNSPVSLKSITSETSIFIRISLNFKFWPSVRISGDYKKFCFVIFLFCPLMRFQWTFYFFPV